MESSFLSFGILVFFLCEFLLESEGPGIHPCGTPLGPNTFFSRSPLSVFNPPPPQPRGSTPPPNPLATWGLNHAAPFPPPPP